MAGVDVVRNQAPGVPKAVSQSSAHLGPNTLSRLERGDTNYKERLKDVGAWRQLIERIASCTSGPKGISLYLRGFRVSIRVI